MGTIPYGWHYDADGTPAECAHEQAVITQVREWHKQGFAYEAIAARLTARGVRPPKASQQWGNEQVKRLLFRPQHKWKGRASKPATIYMDMRGNVVPAPET